jgi:hypothetical protein
MDERVRNALANDRTIDITTIGRTSGLPRRIETWFYRVDDQIYLAGSPAPPQAEHCGRPSGSGDPDHRPRGEARHLQTHPPGSRWNRGSGGLVGGEPAGGGALQQSILGGLAEKSLIATALLRSGCFYRRTRSNNVALLPLTVR